MFVRWEVRKRTRRGGGGDVLIATLARSRRIDGKPRQQHIAYLSSVKVRYNDLATPAHPIAFWEGAEWALDQLDLSRVDRDKIEAQLARRVPQPPA
jgi:hypothetical protein